MGNYGSGWQNQQTEFAKFPGPIVMTSNCIIDPNVGNYGDRIWTRSIVGWPGVNHLEGDDFGAVIRRAQGMNGFPYTEIEHLITVGFGRQTLLNAADTVIDLVSQKNCATSSGRRLRRQPRRAQLLHRLRPQRAARLPDHDAGLRQVPFQQAGLRHLEGLPRLLDVGQCNDAYSAIMLAVKLADTLGCSVNELPLSPVLSWFEQKAIVILLTLLSLG